MSADSEEGAQIARVRFGTGWRGRLRARVAKWRSGYTSGDDLVVRTGAAIAIGCFCALVAAVVTIPVVGLITRQMWGVAAMNWFLNVYTFSGLFALIIAVVCVPVFGARALHTWRRIEKVGKEVSYTELPANSILERGWGPKGYKRRSGSIPSVHRCYIRGFGAVRHVADDGTVLYHRVDAVRSNRHSKWRLVVAGAPVQFAQPTPARGQVVADAYTFVLPNNVGTASMRITLAHIRGRIEQVQALGKIDASQAATVDNLLDHLNEAIQRYATLATTAPSADLEAVFLQTLEHYEAKLALIADILANSGVHSIRQSQVYADKMSLPAADTIPTTFASNFKNTNTMEAR